MEYNKVEFSKTGVAYQEIDQGKVVRYVDESGSELFVSPPEGEGCKVVEAGATPTIEMSVATADRIATKEAEVYDWTRQGDRRNGMPGRRLFDALPVIKDEQDKADAWAAFAKGAAVMGNKDAGLVMDAFEKWWADHLSLPKIGVVDPMPADDIGETPQPASDEVIS